jgi:hypothetical protein
VLFLTVPDSISQHFNVGPGVLRWERSHRQLAGTRRDCSGAAGQRARGQPIATGCDSLGGAPRHGDGRAGAR